MFFKSECGALALVFSQSHCKRIERKEKKNNKRYKIAAQIFSALGWSKLQEWPGLQLVSSPRKSSGSTFNLRQ